MSKRRKATEVIFPDGLRIVFDRQLSREVAIRRALQARRQQAKPVDLDKSIRSFRRFHRKSPRELRSIKLDLSKPLVRIGRVPELHYESSKEGKPTHYVHMVKHKGTMYADPGGKFFVIVGGSTRVRDWLYD